MDGRTHQGLAKTSAPSQIILTNDPQTQQTQSSSCFCFPFWKSRKFLFLPLRSTKTAGMPIRKVYKITSQEESSANWYQCGQQDEDRIKFSSQVEDQNYIKQLKKRVHESQ